MAARAWSSTTPDYTVAIGREDGAAGLGASYQFLLTRAVK